MPAPIHRCLAVWLVATATSAALVDVLLPVALAPAARFDDALVRLCAAVATSATAWLWAITTTVALEARRGRSRVPVPAPLRRLVLSGCGVALVAGMASPAVADPVRREPQHASAVVEGALASLPLPDRAHGGPGPQLSRSPDAEPDAISPSVIVQPGDTLWGLAAEHLGDGSRWSEIYALNRAAVGADPDLIRPAQRLQIPPDAHLAPSAPKETR